MISDKEERRRRSFLRFGDIEFFGFLLSCYQLLLSCAKVLSVNALDGIGDGVEQMKIHGLIIGHV